MLILTLNIYSDIISEIAIVKLSIYFVRSLQLSKLMEDILYFSAIITAKKLIYLPIFIIAFIFQNKKQKRDNLKSWSLHNYEIVIYVKTQLLILELKILR